MTEAKQQTKRALRALEIKKGEVELRRSEVDLRLTELEAQVAARKFDEVFTSDPSARGVFHLEGEIGLTSCTRLLSRVERYAYLNDGAEIRIYLETPGGAVIPGLALYDGLRATGLNGHRIITLVRGVAGSMGAVLLQAGDERLIGPESFFMIHEISSLAFGKLHEMENDVERTRMLNRRIFDIIARRTSEKWTAASLYDRVRTKEWWLSADQAVKNKFADGIG